MGTTASRVFSADARIEGTYYSAVDDVWRSTPAVFNAAAWESLRRTPQQASRISEYDPIVESADIDDDPALGSSGSESLECTIPDATGGRSKMAKGAHFIPCNKTCAVAFGQAAEMALGLNLQHDRNRTRKRHRLVVGVMETKASKRQKRANTGLKHSILNKLRIKGQKEYMNNRPCLLLVPLLSLPETKAWKSGDEYSALVCAGGYDGGLSTLNVSADQVYADACTAFLPRCSRNELQTATDLLTSFVKGLAHSLTTGECLEEWSTNPAERIKLENVRAKLARLGRVGIPVLRGADEHSFFRRLRVAKVRFDPNDDTLPDPPDPFLLTLKAALVWSWRNGEKLLPVCFESEQDEWSEGDEIAQEYAESLRRQRSEKKLRPSDHRIVARGLGYDVDETTEFKLD